MNAWRYRDYVIDSFNADKPYDRFVQEQIAADELWPDNLDLEGSYDLPKAEAENLGRAHRHRPVHDRRVGGRVHVFRRPVSAPSGRPTPWTPPAPRFSA